MAVFQVGRRNFRNAFMFAAMVLLLYMPLKAIWTLSGSSGSGFSGSIGFVDDLASLEAKSDTKQLPVVIKNVIREEEGKLDVVLQLDMKDIVSLMDKMGGDSKEFTSNPIPRNITIVRHDPDICTKAVNLTYIIYVHSSPTNRDRRQLVRTTWANKDLFKDGRTRVVFLVGTPTTTKGEMIVNEEFEKHGDIIQGDFLDDYQNLTLKAIMGLKWVSEFCKNAKFAIKADDDAFVDIFSLTRIVQENADSDKLVVCPQWRDNGMPILRDPEKCMKWCVKYSEFPGRTHFPKYCAGLSFTLSREVVREMYGKVSQTPFFWIDDVYITGILTAKVPGIEYVNLLRNFSQKEDEALVHYLTPRDPVTLYFIHVKSATNYRTFWRQLLTKLPIQDLRELNRHILEPYPRLLDKLDGKNRIHKAEDDTMVHLYLGDALDLSKHDEKIGNEGNR